MRLPTNLKSILSSACLQIWTPETTVHTHCLMNKTSFLGVLHCKNLLIERLLYYYTYTHRFFLIFNPVLLAFALVGKTGITEWTECVYGYMFGKSLTLFEQHFSLGWGGCVAIKNEGWVGRGQSSWANRLYFTSSRWYPPSFSHIHYMTL